MSAFPPRRRLAQVLRSLAARLPAQVAPLLEHTRFADDAAALARFAQVAHADAATAALPPEEAAWLADLLLERWARIADPVLDPDVAIVAPDEVWLGKEPRRVPLAIETSGVDPDWEAVWEGDVVPGPPARTGQLLAGPPPGNAPVLLRATARVRARAGGERCVLVAQATVRVRRPVVVVSENRRRILVCDQQEQPAAAVRLEIGERAYTTSAAGLVELAEPAPPGATLRVEGVPAGRVPGESVPLS